MVLEGTTANLMHNKNVRKRQQSRYAYLQKITKKELKKEY
jgi:hypothetical protein